ncbi:LytR/AlgR family response regulator transcription factor [Spirosoma areae]
MMTCLIVDDEPLAVHLLTDHVAQVPFLDLVCQCHHALDALLFIQKQAVDLLFLDINMPRLTGMDLTDLAPATTGLIFTTAYSDYAVRSYEKNAIDYLLKPITFERFLRAATKAHDLHTTSLVPTLQPGKMPDQPVLFVKSGRSLVRLDYGQVLYIEGLKDYVTFHTDTGPVIVHKRLRDLEQTLPTTFHRIHYSHIINLTKVQKIEDNHVHIGPARLSISDTYRQAFLHRLSSLIG